MAYLVSQLVVVLLMAAALGFLVGFLLSRRLSRTHAIELRDNWKAKLLIANRKLEIVRWELRAGTAKADAANECAEELRKQLAALGSDLEGQTAEMERLRSQATASSGHDDLKQIFGIGPVLEKRLNELGIHFFRQIAQWTTEDIQRLEQQLPKFQKRVERDRWVERAKERHFEKYGELP